jgi:predicted metal-binding protein
MDKVAVIGYGSYMDQGYGCPGEWRCLKSVSLGKGTFLNPSQVVAFIKCECPDERLFPRLEWQPDYPR